MFVKNWPACRNLYGCSRVLRRAAFGLRAKAPTEGKTMSKKLLLALAACLPLALAGCLGGGGASSSPVALTPSERERATVRILDRLDVVHMEMTNVTYIEDRPDEGRVVVVRYSVSCPERDGNSCPVVREGGLPRYLELNRQEATFANVWDVPYLSRWMLNSGTVTSWPSGVNEFRNIDNFRNFADNVDFYINSDAATTAGAVAEILAGIGQHSGAFTYSAPVEGYLWNNNYSSQVVGIVFSAALGNSRTKPEHTLESLKWNGAMIGTDNVYSTKLVGDAEITYNVARNTVNVGFDNIRKATSAGLTSFGESNLPDSLDWNELPVGNDGSFSIVGYEKTEARLPDNNYWYGHPEHGYIDGDFYGPNAEETAGVFRRGRISGAWIAVKEPES